MLGRCHRRPPAQVGDKLLGGWPYWGAPAPQTPRTWRLRRQQGSPKWGGGSPPGRPAPPEVCHLPVPVVACDSAQAPEFMAAVHLLCHTQEVGSTHGNVQISRAYPFMDQTETATGRDGSPGCRHQKRERYKVVGTPAAAPLLAAWQGSISETATAPLANRACENSCSAPV